MYELTKERVEKLYENTDKTLNEICKGLGISVTWFRHIVKSYNIPLIRQKSKGYRLYMSRKLKGRRLTHEWIEKSRQSRSGINHPFYGKHRTEEARLKIRKGVMKFRKNNPDLEKIRLTKLRKTMKKFETKMKMSIAQKRRFQLYPETHPNVVMSRQQVNKGFISKQQRRLYEILRKKFLDVKLNYPISTQFTVYFADIGIPSKKVDIEYDGEFWHKNKIKDIIRDTELEKVDWKVIRINEKNLKNFIEGTTHGKYLY